MKEGQDYIRDIAEMRSMMERSSKFLSLSGLAGIMAGTYALLGAFIAYRVFHFNSAEIANNVSDHGILTEDLLKIFFLAIITLILAVSTAIFLSQKKALKRGQKLWDHTAKRLLINMSVPLVAGGLLVLILILKGLVALMAPFTLIFYGLALYNASKLTYGEVRSLGIIQIVLGLVSAYFVEYGLLCWAIGFGVFHIIYGIYMHYRYER